MKGTAMMTMIALSVAGIPSCMQSSTVPPPASIPGPQPFTPAAPSMTPAPVPLTTPEPVAPQTFPGAFESTENPWEPTAEARDWKHIVIHHTATDQGSVESIHESHLDRKWLGIGYHFVIGNGNGMEDGAIESTFRWREQIQGAHAGNREYNELGIGVCLIGNFQETSPTPAQLASVKRLVRVLKGEYAIDSDHVIGHKEVKATECPGKLFPLTEVSQVGDDRRFGQWPTHQSTMKYAATEGNR